MYQLGGLKRGKVIRNILLILISFFIFFNLNKIVYFFLDDSVKLHKVLFDDYNVEKPAYAYLNELEYHQDEFQEILCCTGWAFAETTEPNDNKSVYLIFKGKRNTYVSDKCALGFSSVQDDTMGWKDTYGVNHNFAINISTLLLPVDTYEIYVYVEENENSKGIVNAGQSFKKDGVRLYTYSLGEIVNSIDPGQINNLFDYGWIDNLSNGNGCIEVTGWQAIENGNSENSKYYLVFIGNNTENVTIQIPSIIRVGVGSYLGSNNQNACGFRGALDKENLPDETGVVYVIAENEGEFYRTEAYPYDINAKEE